MASGPSRADNPTEITLTQSTAYSISFVPIYVALRNRLFDDEGFHVNLVVTNGSGPRIIYFAIAEVSRMVMRVRRNASPHRRNT